MKLSKTTIRGLVCIDYHLAKDSRGEFLKLFTPNPFRRIFPAKKLEEIFITRSAKNVLRGMHYQLSPFDHDKLVSCIQGKILDVVFDMRKRSKTFGCYEVFKLCANRPQGLIVPRGCAHGFLSLMDDSLVCYLTNRRHSPAKDAGIHPKSFGFVWPVKNPILSQRDKRLPSWGNYVSPF